MTLAQLQSVFLAKRKYLVYKHSSENPGSKMKLSHLEEVGTTFMERDELAEWALLLLLFALFVVTSIIMLRH
jgi:hypothetical protein